MKYTALVAVLVALATPVTPTIATDIISFGEIGYGGTGCPDGTANVITNDARTSALLNLSGYSVGDGKRSTDRKTCALAIPVEVPEGVAVAIRGLAIFGNVDLPDGIDATLGLEAFVAGDTGEPTELTLTGPRTGNWFRAVSVPWNDLVWTACGKDSILRVNTSLRTKGNAGAKVSADNLVLFRFMTKAC
jgi:hypothetical protein